tara:strand:+ start:294 stop:458 length:165 start_codon:yes stop_codon:yes gene_type:complete
VGLPQSKILSSWLAGAAQPEILETFQEGRRPQADLGDQAAEELEEAVEVVEEQI